jgi:DNA polymerase-3 subunit delta'
VIVGHEAVLGRLWAAAARDALHHALLFEGPRGVGKHTAAIRLAMAVNCEAVGPEAGPWKSPCGKCKTCASIAAGLHPDVLTVVPASDSASGTIAVDAVREVIRKIGYHRYGAKKRFVVIDPAEALAPAAANALLKTLEEPPEGTHLVLVAANASGLLPTILSRSQRVRFGAVPEPELVRWLATRGIADAERIARAAEGAPGRALDLAKGGLVDRIALRDRITQGISGDLAGILKLSQELAEARKGGRVAVALELLEELVRDAAISASSADVPLTHPDRAERSAAWGKALWPGGINALSAVLQRAREEMLVNVNTRLVLDAVLSAFATELGPARRA